MGLFNKKTGPVILKEDSDAERFIAEMTELARETPESRENLLEDSDRP